MYEDVKLSTQLAGIEQRQLSAITVVVVGKEWNVKASSRFELEAEWTGGWCDWALGGVDVPPLAQVAMMYLAVAVLACRGAKGGPQVLSRLGKRDGSSGRCRWFQHGC